MPGSSVTERRRLRSGGSRPVELPTVADAAERLTHLRQHGPTPTAFTFRERFPAAGAELLPAVEPTHRL